MAFQTVIKRSTTVTVNTDTVLFTPAAGVKTNLLSFLVAAETLAQAAGQTFELRYGSNAICSTGFDTATAPIGQTSKPAIIAHEFVGDGVTTVVGRNTTALTASTAIVYTITYNSNY